MLETFKTLISGVLEVAKSYKGDWNENDSSSPNYIKNRTHYTTEGDVVLFEDYSISIDAEPVIFSPPDDKGLIIGETYKVIWDEIEYNCKAFEFEGMSVIGNVFIVGGNNTGEPFFVATGTAYYDTAEGGNMWVAFGGQGEHVFSIYKKGGIVHKLDKKYLPEDIDEVIKDKFPGGIGYMIPAGTELVNIKVNGGMNTWLSDISFLSSGRYYYVSFNGFNGYLEAYIDEYGDISLGNLDEYGFLLYQLNGVVIGKFDVSGTLIVKTDEELPIPIDSRFVNVQLPEGIVTQDNISEYIPEEVTSKLLPTAPTGDPDTKLVYYPFYDKTSGKWEANASFIFLGSQYGNTVLNPGQYLAGVPILTTSHNGKKGTELSANDIKLYDPSIGGNTYFRLSRTSMKFNANNHTHSVEIAWDPSDGSLKFNHTLPNGSSSGQTSLKNIATPVNAYDAVNKEYVDNLIGGVENGTY